MALEAVQKALAAEKDARQEERFFWICGLVFLFDFFHFAAMDSWTGPIVVGILQFVVLIALGRRLGVDYIWTLTEKVIEKWDGRIRK